MERQEIIKELKEFFKIQELVSGVVYRTFSEETCWSFFRTEFLHTLLIIRRDIVKSSLTCNDWASGGTHTQRGLRENTCALVRDKTNQNSVYMSAHILGAAADLVSATKTAEELRRLIIENAYLLPYKIRIESDVTWLHFDVVTVDSQITKVKRFS